VEDAAAPHVQAAYRYLSRSGRGRSSHCEPAKHEVPTRLPSPGFTIGGRGGSLHSRADGRRVATYFEYRETAASVVSAGGGVRDM
jgi:hypothetical protein